MTFDELFSLLDTITKCLRCGAPCWQARPFCDNCILTRFLLSNAALREQIEGTPECKGIGPEIFFNRHWMNQIFRPNLARILAHSQMREDEIDWIEVVGNWGLPWPKGREPHENASY